MRRLQDYKYLAMKTGLQLGYSPTMNLLLPRNHVVERRYEKTEDFIPFLLTPQYQESVKYDSFGQVVRRKKQIIGLTPDPIFMDFSQGGGINLFVSPTGAGKTFAMRGMIGDLIDSGYVCFAIDVKNEFVSSLKPVQDKFKHLLPPWRRPKALPIKPMFPTYLRKKNIPKEWIIQIDIKDMKVEDMLTALELDPNNAQAQILLTVWREESVPENIDKLIWRVSRVNASQILAKLLPKGAKLKAFEDKTKSTLIRKLIILKSQGIFGSHFPFDVVKLLQDGYFPVLCLNEDDRKKFYHSTYIAVLVRKIYEASKRIGRRIVFIIEDAGSYAIPSKENPSCKDIILKQLIPLGRRRGLYILAAIQNLSQIPEEAVSQVKCFVFFGRVSGFDLEKIAKVRKMRYKPLREKMSEYAAYSELPNGMRGCVTWDENGKANFGFVPAPSSFHLEKDL